jgi:hypothetical protein
MCVAGVCQSNAIATAQAGVFGLAIDATNLYWATDVPNASPTFTTDSAVMKAPLAGGAPVLLGKVLGGRGYDLAVDATSVYLEFQWNDFNQEGEIHKVPLAGGAESALSGFQTNPRGLVLGVGYLYWGQENQAQVKGVSLTGGATPSFYDPNYPNTVTHGVAADATSVYGALDFPAMVGGGGLIWKYPAAGGAHVAVATGQEGPNYLAQDATNLYWTNTGRVGGVKLDHQGTVVKMPKAGGAVTILASGLGGAKRIAVDATSVYWNDDVDGVIMKVPIAGGASTILATGQMGANGLAVGPTYVYWTDSIALTVMKAVK